METSAQIQQVEQESITAPTLPKPQDLYEYETQHFGFTPTSLVNGMFNTVCDFYRDGLKAFAKACSEKCPNTMSEDELVTARHTVAEKIDRHIELTFDTLEYYLLTNVFSIPESVVLPEDRVQLSRSSTAEEDKVQRKKDELKREIIAIKLANAKLSQHLERANSCQAMLNELLDKLTSKEGDIAELSAEGVADYISYFSEVLRKSAVQDQS